MFGSYACHVLPRTDLDLLLVEGNALDNLETRRFVRFRVCQVRSFQDGLVFCSVGKKNVSSRGQLTRWGFAYAVRFLLPLGWRSESAIGVEGSGLDADEGWEAGGSELLLSGEEGCSSGSEGGDGSGEREG